MKITLSKQQWLEAGQKAGWIKEAKWGKKDVVNPSEKGKYEGRSQESLRSQLSSLKEKQEAYKKKHDGKAKQEYTDTIRELEFALRSKTGWGKVNK